MGDYDQERIRQFTEGALHLDIIDVARKQLIWEAMAEHRVKSAHAYADEDVRAAMTGMFAGFPPGRPLPSDSWRGIGGSV